MSADLQCRHYGRSEAESRNPLQNSSFFLKEFRTGRGMTGFCSV
jgi:hypothetical protein